VTVAVAAVPPAAAAPTYELLTSNVVIDAPTKAGALTVDTGGLAITDFRVIGEEYVDEDTARLRCIVNARVSHNFFTTYGKDDVFYFAARGTYSKMWLRLWATGDVCWDPYDPDEFYARVPVWVVWTFPLKARGFSGTVDVDYRLEDRSGGLEIDAGSYTAYQSAFEATLTRAKVTASEWGPVGDYADVWEGDVVTETRLQAVVNQDEPASKALGDAVSAFNDWVEEQRPGARLVNTDPSDPSRPRLAMSYFQQGVVSPPTVGAFVENGITLVNKPRIDAYLADLELRTLPHDISNQDTMPAVTVDTEDSLFSPAGFRECLGTPGSGPTLTTYRLNNLLMGWHVQNYNVRVTVELEWELYTTLDITPTEGGTGALALPQLHLSDVYWQTMALGGATDVEISFKETDWLRWLLDWWNRYKLPLVALVLVAVAVAVLWLLRPYVKVLR